MQTNLKFVCRKCRIVKIVTREKPKSNVEKSYVDKFEIRIQKTLDCKNRNQGKVKIECRKNRMQKNLKFVYRKHRIVKIVTREKPKSNVKKSYVVKIEIRMQKMSDCKNRNQGNVKIECRKIVCR